MGGRIDYIIHCAASIRFDLPIQAALEQNFTPTERLVDLAAGMPRLQCFTYMSTAFVNANQPNGTLLEERLYDLYDLGGGLDTDGAMATRLRTMDAKEANQQVPFLHAGWQPPQVARWPLPLSGHALGLLLHRLACSLRDRARSHHAAGKRTGGVRPWLRMWCRRGTSCAATASPTPTS